MEKNKLEFHMQTDWIVKDPIDLEQKEYVMLAYFQKIDKKLEDNKLYPEFTELSLHLANLQTLHKQNQILNTNRKLSSLDDEYTLYDLETKKIENFEDEKYEKLRNIINTSLPKFKKKFEDFKVLWTKVYDSIEVKINKKTHNKKIGVGFFFFNLNNQIYIYKFTNRKFKNTTKTKLFLLEKTDNKNINVYEVIKKHSSDKENNFFVFEVLITKEYPLEETLIPVIKRKILSNLTRTKNLSEKI